MKKSRTEQVTRMPRYLRFNIGTVVFVIIFIYFLIYLLSYVGKTNISVYEVRFGSIDDSEYLTGLAVRSESLYYAEYQGSVNYYVSPEDKVAYGDLICSIDKSGDISSKITEAGKSAGSLSSASLDEISTYTYDYAENYDAMSFYEIYDFKNQINSLVQTQLYIEALESISADQTGDSFQRVYSSSDGIIVFYEDGYESVTPDNFTPDVFDPSGYAANNLKASGTVGNGDPIYKLISDENWYIMVPVSEEDIEKYGVASGTEDGEVPEDTVLYVTFKKDGTGMYVTAHLKQYQDEYFLQLDLNSSMVRFATDRYIELEIGTDDKSGLKIPNSAITEMEFLKIPADYFTDGEGSAYSLNLVKYSSDDEDAASSVELVSVEKYDEDDEYYYIPEGDINVGDRIKNPDTGEEIVLDDTVTLQGVYEVNQGFASFRMIEIIAQNDEYSVLSEGTSYGLSLYDRIVLDGSSVTENQIVY